MADLTRRKLLIGTGVVAAAAAGAGLHAVSGPGAALVTPGRSRARAIETDAKLPDAVDVAVIGGGFVGTTAALYLAQRGVPVALFEKGAIGGEASGRSTGWVEAQFQAPLKLAVTEHSRALWRGLNALTGEETGYRDDRLLVPYQMEAEVDAARQWLERVKGLPNGQARVLSAQATAALVPGTWAGALYSTGEGKAEPTLAAPAIALGARKLGARVYQGCAVRGLDLQGGRVAGVVTERGLVKARTVILAGGVWSPLMLRSLGLDLPQVSANATMSSIRPGAPGPEFSAILPGPAVLRRQLDGGYVCGEPLAVAPITPDAVRRIFGLLPALRAMGPMLQPTLSWSRFWAELRTPSRWALDAASPFEKVRIYEPEIHPGRIHNGWAAAQRFLPNAFADVRLRDQWAGALTTTLDNMPVISEVPQIPGLLVGSGFYFGLTWGPGAGSLLADLATGATPPVDLRPFRFSRFADGSRLEFQA